MDSQLQVNSGEKSAKCSKSDDICSKADLYRQWLQQRQKLRKGLESLGLSDEWLARKPDKTELERRVLRRILEEKYPKIPDVPVSDIM